MVLDVIGCDVSTEAVEEVSDAFEVVQLLSVVEVMFDKTDVDSCGTGDSSPAWDCGSNSC